MFKLGSLGPGNNASQYHIIFLMPFLSSKIENDQIQNSQNLKYVEMVGTSQHLKLHTNYVHTLPSYMMSPK